MFYQYKTVNNVSTYSYDTLILMSKSFNILVIIIMFEVQYFLLNYYKNTTANTKSCLAITALNE